MCFECPRRKGYDFSTPSRQRHSQSSCLHTSLSTVIKNVRRGKERERLCFLSWCESRFMLCSYREKLPATAPRAVSRTDKTLLTQSKPKTWKKEQNPHHGHHAPACGSKERQKGGMATVCPMVRATLCCPHQRPSFLPSCPAWCNPGQTTCPRGGLLLLHLFFGLSSLYKAARVAAPSLATVPGLSLHRPSWLLPQAGTSEPCSWGNFV